MWARSQRGGSPTAVAFAAEANGVLTGSSALTEFETTYGAQLIGATIMRIKYMAVFWTDPPAAGSSNAAASFGFLVQNQLAAIPAAASNVDADWMWHETRYFIHGPEDTLDGAAYHHIQVDIKARRRLDELGDSLFHYVKVEPGSTNPTTLRFIADWSVLVALP